MVVFHKDFLLENFVFLFKGIHKVEDNRPVVGIIPHLEQIHAGIAGEKGVVEIESLMRLQDTVPITEFISVGMHAVVTYTKKKEGKIPEHLAVWGDGALGYVICCLLKYFYPQVHLTVIGANRTKLGMFWFADVCLTIDEVAESPQFDDAFECVGGQEAGNAIAQMIETVMPEGILTLMGVSEEPVPINTRLVLEKGLVLLGRSRSAKEDFEKVIEILETNQKFADRIRMLISEVVEVREVDDIHRAFDRSLLVDFKLVMDWKL